VETRKRERSGGRQNSGGRKGTGPYGTHWKDRQFTACSVHGLGKEQEILKKQEGRKYAHTFNILERFCVMVKKACPEEDRRAEKTLLEKSATTEGKRSGEWEGREKCSLREA